MDFNFTSKEYTNKTFHLVENVSLDEHSMNVNSPVPSAVMMTFYVFLFLIVEILGNFLLLSMITYEKYGMDPQKRTVTNQLLSSICIRFGKLVKTQGEPCCNSKAIIAHNIGIRLFFFSS